MRQLKNLLDKNVDHPVLASNTGTPQWRHIVNRPLDIILIDSCWKLVDIRYQKSDINWTE